MTKAIRIENADTSEWRVVVEVWQKNLGEGDSDLLINTFELNNPADMVTEYVHGSQYLVIREAIPTVN